MDVWKHCPPIQLRRYWEGDCTNNLNAGVRFTLELRKKKKYTRFWRRCYQNLTTLYITLRNYYSNKQN